MGEAAYLQALDIYNREFRQRQHTLCGRHLPAWRYRPDPPGIRERREQKYLEALRIYENNLVEDDPVVVANHSRLAKLYVALRDDKFAGHADKVIRYTPDKDGPAVPLFVMQPRYPVFEDGTRPTGWALVEFTVTTDGRVLNPGIVESRPRRVI